MSFIKNNIVLILFIFFAVVCFFFSVGHIANPYLDVGREMYYPKAILDGEILYKDIFCIYFPLSYLINAFLYKILGISLNSIYFGGAAAGVLIFALLYKIARKFLPEFQTCAIVFFAVVTGALSSRIFNFSLPYSYGIVYGLLCFLISVYLTISYKNEQKPYKLIIASVFAGFAVANKYEFLLYLIPFSFAVFKTKKPALILKCALSGFLALFLPFLFLFLKGLSLGDLINSFELIKNFAHTQALNNFYTTQGVYYNPKLWHDWAFRLVLWTVYFLIILAGLKFRKNIFGIILIFFGMLLCFKNSGIYSYPFITFFVVMFFAIFIKKLTATERFFILSSILVSLKSFFALGHGNYGVYYVGIIFVSFFILISKLAPKIVQNALVLLLLALSLNAFATNIVWLKNINSPVFSSMGSLKIPSQNAETLNKLLFFLKDKQNFMVFPEGLTVNFLLNKRAPYFYNSLIPLYSEGFTDENFIDYYKKNKLNYIIFWDYSFSDYGYGRICEGYAKRFCAFVFENYEEIQRITGKTDSFRIFALK